MSVIIPTHNRATSLVAALESVASQSFRDLEVVVVDDGSTDDTRELMSAWKDVVYIPIRRIGQVGAVRNVGIERSRGDVIAFLDSDDSWYPEKLARQMSLLESRPDCTIVSSNALVDRNLSDDGMSRYFPRLGEDIDVGMTDLVEDNTIIVSTAVVPASTLRLVGGFSSLPILRGIEDYDLWLRLMASAGVARVIAEPLAVYRDIPESSMRSERSRIEEILGLLVIFGRLNAALPGGDPRRSVIERRAASLVAELGFYRWARRRTRLGRSVARLRPGGTLPRLRFASSGADGWLTVAPRRLRGRPGSDADAYADIDELYLPRASLQGASVVASEELDPDAAGSAAAAALGWLAQGALLTLELQEIRGVDASKWKAAIEREGFSARRATSGTVEYSRLGRA